MMQRAAAAVSANRAGPRDAGPKINLSDENVTASESKGCAAERVIEAHGRDESNRIPAPTFRSKRRLADNSICDVSF
jgi:hypothetical protein